MKYHFKIHKEGRGYWAECLELEGCQTQASSRAELARNMSEALDAYLDESSESDVLFPLPDAKLKGSGVVEVKASASIAFAFYLRRLRILHGWTQLQAAQALGVKNVYSYQRLEKSKTANPELRTIEKIKEVFPKFRIEDILG